VESRKSAALLGRNPNSHFVVGKTEVIQGVLQFGSDTGVL
jgi:hypothetical protein